MRNLTSRQIAVILGCVLTVATLAVGIDGLVRGPQSAESTSGPPPPGELEAIPAEATPVVTLKDRALPHTNDPIAYSRAVASSLFDWDTSLGFLPTDYTAAVLPDADPSGKETPGLIADVATYLPTVDQWLDLGAMEVRRPKASASAARCRTASARRTPTATRSTPARASPTARRSPGT